MLKKILFILFATVLTSYAQLSSWNTYGYVKYLYSYSKLPLYNAKNLSDNEIHIRLNNRWYPTQNLTAGLELRLRAFYGGSVEKIPEYASFIKTSYPYGNLDATFWNSKKSLGYGQVDRLFLDYNSGNWQITLGRQRIAWGTSLVWNVVDLFNPQSILDFDYEEKPGSDAIRIQYFTAAIGRVEVALKPADDKYEQTAAFLWLTNFSDYDFYTIAAWYQDKPLFGAAFSGDISGAGFRGELKWTGRPHAGQLGKTKFNFGNDFSDGPENNLCAVLSLDYTFPNSFYIHGEALYNSLGKTQKAGLFTFQAQKAGLLSPARWSLFSELAYDVHPLVRADFFSLYNPVDKSIVYVPSVSWSALTNLDVYLIALLTDGTTLSEFGSGGDAYFLRFKYSF